MEEEFKSHLETLLNTYTAATSASVTYVAREAARDGYFFTDLFRNNKSCTLRKLTEIVQWFSDNWPDGVDWPEGFPRPTPSCTEVA